MNISQHLHIPTSHQEQWTLETTHGDTYQLFISRPSETPPEEGFPTIYVLDGNAFFETVANVVHLQSRRHDKTGVPPAIIVGIGYPEEKPFVAERRFKDFTPTLPEGTTPLAMPNGRSLPEGGGAEFFHLFLKEEVLPFIENVYHTSQERILFGHSLGGLYTLYTLFHSPDLFTSYISGSPSIWWGERAAMKWKKQFTEEKASSQEGKKLVVSVGGSEREHMVEDARRLASSLLSSTLDFEYIEAEEENHMSVVPATISRSLRFVFK